MPGRWRNVVATLDPGRPVLIAGPTASGKSDLALAIAEAQGGRIVNADALQVFSDWRILTARPSETDLRRAPHLLYGHVPGSEAYSVGQWLHDLRRCLDGAVDGDAVDGDARPIIVGGTGLYFSALTEGLAEIPPTPAAVRAEADRRIARDGATALAAELDRATSDRIDLQNPMRVQRAWEVLRATGRGLADWQADTAPPLLAPEAAQTLVLAPRREWLAQRIAQRFDAMLDAGVLDEARANAPDWRPDLPSAKAIGAAELVGHLRGEIPLEAVREATLTNTRQFAKRQRTWFRSRMKAWRWIDPSDP